MTNEKDELPPFTYKTQLDELQEARAEIARLWAELKSIHDDARCPTWVCERIEELKEQSHGRNSL